MVSYVPPSSKPFSRGTHFGLGRPASRLTHVLVSTLPGGRSQLPRVDATASPTNDRLGSDWQTLSAHILHDLATSTPQMLCTLDSRPGRLDPVRFSWMRRYQCSKRLPNLPLVGKSCVATEIRGDQLGGMRSGHAVSSVRTGGGPHARLTPTGAETWRLLSSRCSASSDMVRQSVYHVAIETGAPDMRVLVGGSEVPTSDRRGQMSCSSAMSISDASSGGGCRSWVPIRCKGCGSPEHQAVVVVANCERPKTLAVAP
jgi:hypothetical protein